MSSPYLTGRNSEMLDALPIVYKLAEDTLTSEELEKAENISIMLAGSKKQRRDAIYYLTQLVSPPPKRPLEYAQMEIRNLPRWTRDAIRYLGDYIDLLTKELAFKCTNDIHCKQYSLGKNLHILKPKKYRISQQLMDKLTRYNSFLYSPGKHDFNLPLGRRHRFTCKEVVFTAFITMKLGNQIQELLLNTQLRSTA